MAAPVLGSLGMNYLKAKTGGAVQNALYSKLDNTKAGQMLNNTVKKGITKVLGPVPDTTSEIMAKIEQPVRNIAKDEAKNVIQSTPNQPSSSAPSTPSVTRPSTPTTPAPTQPKPTSTPAPAPSGADTITKRG